MKHLPLALFAAAAIVSLAGCDNVVFDSAVKEPAFSGKGPMILFDAGHHNHHRISSTYRPFAKLLKNDGFEIAPLNGSVDPQELAKANILAIVTAASQTETNAEPAFTPAEVASIVGWVRGGGSLLLVTDHYPFPNAVEPLAAALGLDVAKGMTLETSDKNFRGGDDSRLVFTRENGLLTHHPVTEGRNPGERVNVVETFTGDAFRPRNASIQPVLRLAPTAVNRVGRPEVSRKDGDAIVTVQFGDPTPGSGWMQGVAFDFGRGRVVALAEAAMVTAQEDGGKKIGMNAPGNDNRQFLLNVMHWLARVY